MLEIAGGVFLGLVLFVLAIQHIKSIVRAVVIVAGIAMVGLAIAAAIILYDYAKDHGGKDAVLLPYLVAFYIVWFIAYLFSPIIDAWWEARRAKKSN